MSTWMETNDALYEVCKDIKKNKMKNIKVTHIKGNEYEIDVTKIKGVQEAICYYYDDENCNYILHLDLADKQYFWEDARSYFEIRNLSEDWKTRYTNNLNFNGGGGWGRHICEMISKISKCSLAKEWKTRKELVEEDLEKFRHPSIFTIRGWNFYKDYQMRAYNRCFNETLFEDLKEWWTWIWKGYYEKFDWQIKELRTK